MMGGEYVSACCSAAVINPGMCETGICSDCGEHCGWVDLSKEDNGE